MIRALLVDDEQVILGLLSKLLEKDGFEVETASSAAQGVAALEQSRPFDIVITDLRMESPLAGFQVVRAANRVVPRPVIVVLTAFPVPGSDWKNEGADALYVKGSNPMALPRQIKALLKQRT